MMQAADMFRTHPRQSQVEFSLLAKCVDECYACAPTCTTYANVCLGRANVAELVRCKYLNEVRGGVPLRGYACVVRIRHHRSRLERNGRGG